MAKAALTSIPVPTPIYRIIHVDNLPIYLKRGRLHAPNQMPKDGLVWRKIEDKTVQAKRYERALQQGPGGTILDYVPFYFGPRSPMLLRLATKWKVDYNGTQDEIIYLRSTVEEMVTKNRKFVFSDGHGLARFTEWFDALKHLDQLDWEIIHATYWEDTPAQPDRERRKQAEFLVHKSCGWQRILEIGVMTASMKARVEGILAAHPKVKAPPVNVRDSWYYEGK